MVHVKTFTMDTCHKAETKHYAVHYGATFLQKFLLKITDIEEAKPPEARNLLLERLSTIGSLTCIIGKIALNSQLCDPIDARYSLRT